MAKKLNTKVAIIGIVLLVLIIGAGTGFLVLRQIKRNPDRALAKAQQAQQAGDYKTAEQEYRKAVGYSKSDTYKIDRLFDLAAFALLQNDQHPADWTLAMGCWNQVIKLNDKNLPARRALLDYFKQTADAGDNRLWKIINEHTTEILDVLEQQNTAPDTDLLITHAQSILEMAQRGDSPNRKELLADSIQRLESLIEQNPGNDTLYALRAQAALLEGQLNEQTGIRNAQQKATEEALNWLTAGTEKADDKAAAVTALWTYKLNTSPTDPNSIDRFRRDLEAVANTLEPNDDFYVLVSRAYSDRQGNSSALADTNRAIEAVRRARKMAPQNIEHIIRMHTLLYRKGSAFGDPDSISDAISLAEEALTLPNTQDTPGPLQNRNLMYRYLLNTFLANTYLEKAYDAGRQDNETAEKEWTDKARPRIREISDYLKAADNPTVQKFQGMLALAEGDTDKAVRQMYKAYEQLKALDEEGQYSNVDPALCITLADLMKTRNEPGMQKEFLEKAMNNRSGIILIKPQLLLDYAEVLSQFRDDRTWNSILTIVNNYQARYGANDRSDLLKTNALIGLNQFDPAQTMIDAMDPADTRTLLLKTALLSSQITQQRLAIQRTEQENKTPAEADIQKLTDLRKQRTQVLGQLLSKDAGQIDPQSLQNISYDLMQNGMGKDAATLLDQYLAVNPDAVALKTLRLQLQQPNPAEITPQQLQQFQLEAIETLRDQTEKCLALARHYRAAEEYDTAAAQLKQVAESDRKSAAVLTETFEIALAQKDIAAAENLMPAIRAENADRCDGAMFAAQIEMAKENYDNALRQLDNALIIQPLASRIYFLKGQIYNQLQDYEAAVKSLQQAIRMNPFNPQYARGAASALYARNTKLGSKVTPQQKAEALQAVRFAMFLDPGNWQLQSVYAESIAESNPEDAIKFRRRLLESQPNVTNALMLGNMALRQARAQWDAAQKTGLIELAGAAFRKALELEPDNELAQQALADYQAMMGEEDPTKIFSGNQDLIWKYYLRNGQFDKALDILTELVAASPEDSTVLRGLVLANEGLGNRDQTKQALDKLAGMTDEKDTELWVLQKYLDNGYTDEAEKKLAAFEQRYPDETVILLVKAWVQMGNGSLAEALSLTNRYLETDTENAGAWRLRGRLYRLMNDPQKAIADLQRSKSILPDPMVRMELATVYQETANTEGAIGELKQGIEDPQAPLQMRLMLESTYQRNNKTRELNQFYQSTLEKYPQSFFWQYRAGSYYLQQNDLGKARQYLKTAWDLCIRQNSPDFGIFMAYLDSLLKDNQYDAATAFAADWLETPLAAAAYAFTAQVQFKQNNPPAAAESFNKALDKAGTNDSMQGFVLEKMQSTVGESAVTAWIEDQLAKDAQALAPRLLAYRLAVDKARFNDAVKQMDECIDIVGPDHPGWLSLAMKKGNALIMAYAKTADKQYLDRSIEVFETILAKQPNNPSLLNNLAYLLADNDTNLETALKYARQAHQGNPGNTIFLDTYAYIQCKLGQHEPAERNLLRAVQILDISRQPVPWDMYKHLGMAHQGLGKNRQAIQDYQKALEASDEIPDKEKQTLQKTIDELKLLL